MCLFTFYYFRYFLCDDPRYNRRNERTKERNAHTTNTRELNAVNNSRKTRKNYHRRRPQSSDDLFTLLWLFVLKQTPGHSLCVYRPDAPSRCCRYDLMGMERWRRWRRRWCHQTENEFVSIFMCVDFLWYAQCEQGHATFSQNHQSAEPDWIACRFTCGAARSWLAFHYNVHSYCTYPVSIQNTDTCLAYIVGSTYCNTVWCERNQKQNGKSTITYFTETWSASKTLAWIKYVEKSLINGRKTTDNTTAHTVSLSALVQELSTRRRHFTTKCSHLKFKFVCFRKSLCSLSTYRHLPLKQRKYSGNQKIVQTKLNWIDTVRNV